MEDFRLYRWLDACLQPASILTAILLPFVWSLVFYEISQENRRAEEEGIRTAANFARLAENHVYRTIKRVDDVLTTLQGVYKADVSGIPGLDYPLKAEASASALLLSAIDAHGILRARSRGPIPPLDLSDRDHFRHFAHSDLNDLFVSKPLDPKIGGPAVIRIARRLANADGSFGGVVVASLEPRFLHDFFQDLEGERRPMVALVGLDGVVHAARGPDVRADGADLNAADIDPALLNKAGQVAQGIYWTDNPGPDGQSRLIAHRKVEGYPFFVVAALSRTEVLAQNQRSEWLYIGAGWSITFALAIATFLATSREFKLKAALATLANTNARFEASLSNMPHGLCMFDDKQNVVVCNDRYRAMYSLSAEATAPGTGHDNVLAARFKAGSGPADAEGYAKACQHQRERGEPSQQICELRDGRVIAIDYQGLAGGGFVAIHQDITQQTLSEAKIAYLAHHDPLTGLLNRASLLEKIEDCLAHVQRQKTSFVLHLLDLDRFKPVNDSYGHPAGDALLQQVGARLEAELRQTDILARLGGDEFAIVQATEHDPPVEAAGLASRIIEVIARPFRVDGNEISIGTSIGVAIGSEQVTSAARLMKMADLALYDVKARGRNSFSFFEAGLEDAATTRSALETDLRAAMTQGDFVLHYQPIMDARSGIMGGAEALIRWPHKTHGWIGPDRFIPLAEESGLIGEIGQWVLRTACNEAVNWPPETKVSINISAVQLRDPMIVDYVVFALAESGLPPERLELEITETALIDRGLECLTMLKQFKALGVTIALDDFGTGYSSLSQLTMFPFDKIKIDKSFTMNMTSRADCAAVIAGVLALAKSLDIATTAEGVETSQQYNLLRLAGVSSLQGYFIKRPGPASELDFSARFEAKEIARVA